MGIVDLSSYKKLYLETARQNSDVLANNYIKISRNSLDKDALKDMYISAHSLKGKSQAMGYLKIGKLSGMIERVIKNILANNIQVSDGLMAVLKNAIENVEVSLQSIETENKEKDTDMITKKLEQFVV